MSDEQINSNNAIAGVWYLSEVYGQVLCCGTNAFAIRMLDGGTVLRFLNDDPLEPSEQSWKPVPNESENSRTVPNEKKTQEKQEVFSYRVGRDTPKFTYDTEGEALQAMFVELVKRDESSYDENDWNYWRSKLSRHDRQVSSLILEHGKTADNVLENETLKLFIDHYNQVAESGNQFRLVLMEHVRTKDTAEPKQWLRWEVLEEDGKRRRCLFLNTEPRRCVATVWENGTWFTWDANGTGGENDKEETQKKAMIEACSSAIMQGFV